MYKITEIKLLYPDTISGYNHIENKIEIKDELAQGAEIDIKTFQKPIINRELFSQQNVIETDLAKMFEETKEILIERLKEILILD